ncbi:hypothetical protein A2954_06050 [Candidatus Roizmanbacteria bacterium RIFCSPLOWO2_01_FULL_37_12]|uniref:Aldehyde dehydrogenase domain-containing protein n=1 Tax=Candidatus Roizmanbacteria bacterium RIFCSPLOWO2_01_FULL_37_12 TaxID=1802056 RepID=A0A1F7ICI9_9BACT|nr:MAG: hypothetical protein A2768_01210 [Candidatus Roizmanbacteria bacterium RIFCSPHIGHO2_01_FULL_37_16]OGK26041.1 MAG: hypothetical protein A3D76_00305 [Candidatus Roizmanbacteria bacterium RIFCSPHIGHO2_02_FULL_37_9b]OGK41066.1 MAG: hypothetical protein A2954_06050 [Candidatus Roizmanbacteria bacterium RIFCSPLOWO2_01_FULL_37_12]
MKKLISTDPANNYRVIDSVNISLPEEIRQKVETAHKVKKLWKDFGVKKRIKMLMPFYNEFLKSKKEIADLTTKEIGKPISETLDDLDWDQSYFKWFLENGERYLSDDITYKQNNFIHKIIYEPTGVTASIVPWNFPWGNAL